MGPFLVARICNLLYRRITFCGRNSQFLLLIVCAFVLTPPTSDASVKAPATYLFSYFIGNGEDGLHLASSTNGYHWEALKNDHSFLAPEVGESRLMRDPCLLFAPDQTFHMVWTTSWAGKTIGYASSKDLVHWSPQKALPVMMDEPATINCWAPELFWDAAREEFIIFWASTVTNRFRETAGQAERNYNHRIYATTTKDFQTFTPTRLFYDPGFNVIDATMLAARGRFHLIFKDETLNPVKKHLRIAAADSPEGPFTPPAPTFTRNWVEGPTALRVGDDYIVYFDCYREHHYGAMKSSDLLHWEDVTTQLSMPKGMRHGTALAVPLTLIEELNH